MALLKCLIPPFSGACSLVFLPTFRLDELCYNVKRCEVQARPCRRTGVAGGACAVQGAHEQRGMAATAFPPQGFKAAIDRASTFVCVSSRL